MTADMQKIFKRPFKADLILLPFADMVFTAREMIYSITARGNTITMNSAREKGKMPVMRLKISELY